MNLSVHKVPTVFQILNTIVVQQEYDPIIYVQYNYSMLRGVLVDNRVGVNMIIILAYYNAYLIPLQKSKYSRYTLIIQCQEDCALSGKHEAFFYDSI